MIVRIKRQIMPDRVEDMQEGVIYKSPQGNYYYILHYCDDCNKPMRANLKHGKPAWRRCRDCENKRRVKYPPLPENIEDVQEGVVYKDKWGAACVLYPCEICGDKRVTRLMHGKPEMAMCHRCANGTPEKREKQSKLQKGVPNKPEVNENLSKVMKEKYENDPTWKEHIDKWSKSMQGKHHTEETKLKLHEANKGQIHPPGQDKAHSIRMRGLFADEEWATGQRKKMLEGLLNISPEAEEERCRKIAISSKERWSDPETKDNWVRAIFSSGGYTPTKDEIKFDNILQTYVPEFGWRYNGDNSENVVIGGKVPDYVTPLYPDKLIELYGIYHCPFFNKSLTPDMTVEGRKNHFKQYGKDCLVIWIHELENTQAVVQKVKEFMQES